MAGRVLFLFSDTGGGHRASARAVASAIELDYAGHFEVELLDPFLEGSHPFLRWLVYRYGWLIKHVPRLYGMLFHVTDNRALTRAMIRLFRRQFRPGFRSNVETREPAAIVSFHPLLNHVVLEVMQGTGVKVPFITVITDMNEFHRFWMSPRADMVIVPSREARRYCINRGLDARKVHAVGLPVDPRFKGPLHGQAKSDLRKTLGLDDVPTLLLAAGGEGLRRLAGDALAIDRARLDLQVLVVCGRNQKMQAKLERHRWNGNVHVYGFVDNMPELMQAADAVVTKAGPGTIAEALISGLPIFLTSYVPGQEEGNVKFVEENHVGWYVPRRRKLVARLREAFFEDHEEFERMSGRAEALASPGAASEIAQLIAAAVEPPPQEDV